jgi:hypothetical protein
MSTAVNYYQHLDHLDHPSSRGMAENLRRQQSDEESMISSEFEGKSFPYRLFSLISNTRYDSVIRWCPNGDMVIFPNELAFEYQVLQNENKRVFKTRKMKSFVRQLNLYGFHKVAVEKNVELMNFYRNLDERPESIFEHRMGHFKRDHPELLEFVRRTVRETKGAGRNVKNLPPRAPRKNVKRNLTFSPQLEQFTSQVPQQQKYNEEIDRFQQVKSEMLPLSAWPYFEVANARTFLHGTNTVR